MEITNSAKVLLEDFLKEKGKNGFAFEARGHACHMKLNIKSMDIEGDAPEYNGIKILMDEESAESLATVTLDTRDGKLIFIPNSCGSCDSDCHQ